MLLVATRFVWSYRMVQLPLVWWVCCYCSTPKATASPQPSPTQMKHQCRCICIKRTPFLESKLVLNFGWLFNCKTCIPNWTLSVCLANDQSCIFWHYRALFFIGESTFFILTVGLGFAFPSFGCKECGCTSLYMLCVLHLLPTIASYDFSYLCRGWNPFMAISSQRT